MAPATSAALHAYTLPPDLLAKAHALEHLRTGLYFGGTVWTLLILFLLVRGRLGERIALFAERLTSAEESRPRAFLAGLIAAPLWLLVLAGIGLPPAAVGHHVSLAYHLSIEGWLPWLGDWSLSTLLTLLVGTLILSSLYALLRHTPRLAVAWFWLGTLPCIVFGVYITPLLVDPIFNHFTPLVARDPALVAQLEQVVARGGLAIPASRMFVMDASRRYTGMNAYVTGFGASKRVVVWDTTLPGGASGPGGKAAGAGVPTAELLEIYGHEQGHYVLGHIWKGMVYTAALLLCFYWLALRLARGLAERWGEAWHVPENLAEWHSLGLLLLVATALGFVADPLANAFSRMQEHQADVYGQEVIHGLVGDPGAVAVADFNRLGRVWLEDPEPNAFVVWWTYSHPPVCRACGVLPQSTIPGSLGSTLATLAAKSREAQSAAAVGIYNFYEAMEDQYAPLTRQTLTIDEIMALLPHRYPFLLIDRIVEVERGKRIVAIKNVTINEPFFQGHFPDYPIMPGVLVVEAMAQAGGVLVLLDAPVPGDKMILFTGVDGAKFRRPVVPGDQLRIEMTILQLRTRAVRLEGRVYVDGKLACEAILSCGVVQRSRTPSKSHRADPEPGPAPVVDRTIVERIVLEEAVVPAELEAVTTE